MAQTLCIWERAATTAITAGNATEGTGVLQNVHGTTDALLAGAYSGCSVRLTSAVADTIIFRVYDAAAVANVASLGILLHEFNMVFDAQNDPALAEPAYPKPYYAGLVITAEAAAGAGRTATTTPMIEPLAGRRTS